MVSFAALAGCPLLFGSIPVNKGHGWLSFVLRYTVCTVFGCEVSREYIMCICWVTRINSTAVYDSYFV